MELSRNLRLASLTVFALHHLSCARDTSRTIFLTPEEKDIITGWATKKGLQLNTGDLTFELGNIDDAFENTMFDYIFVWGPTITPSKVMNAWRVRQTQVSNNILSTEPMTTPPSSEGTIPEGFTTPTPDITTTTARIIKRQVMGMNMMPAPAMPAMMMSGQPAPPMPTPGMMMTMMTPPAPPKPPMMMMPLTMMTPTRNTRQQPMSPTMQPPNNMPETNPMKPPNTMPTNPMQSPIPPPMMALDMNPTKRFARQTHGHHGGGSHHGGHV